MKVKLKIKHLIMIPIIIFVIVPNFLYFVGKSMFSVRWQFESGVTTREYSYGVFNLYTKWPKVLSPFDGDAYFYMGRVKYDYNMKYVSNGGDAIIGRVIPLGTYEEALALYKKGLQMSNGIDYSLNTIALFNLHMEKGNLEEAKKLIDESLDKKSYKENSAGKVLEVQLAIMENDKNKGRELYKKYYRESRNTVIEKLLEMDNDDYYVEDNRNIGDEIKFYNEKSFLDELSANINIPRVYKLREYNEDGSDKLLKGNVTVKGKLTLEGKPLKYVPIIVGNVGFSEYTDDFSYGQIEGKVIYTDKDGNYEINGLPELEIINVSPILSMDTGEKYVTEEKYIKKTKNNKVYELNLDYKKRMNINIDEDLKLEGNKFDINFDKVNGAEY
ncbi:MAG: tetratricopeptide repeat protein, partial [Clostridium sp.]|uniref:tetratricopeptide repeat protein n=1 Tax=Clostridium sp. TaxID=1506 RepID=UPI003EE609ED